MSEISEKLVSSIRASVKSVFGIEPAENMVMVERPRDPKMGDYSTNIAMRLAKPCNKSTA